jgi:hypothetical protein
MNKSPLLEAARVCAPPSPTREECLRVVDDILALTMRHWRSDRERLDDIQKEARALLARCKP